MATIEQRRTRTIALATIFVAAAEFVYLWYQGRFPFRSWAGIAIYSSWLAWVSLPYDQFACSRWSSTLFHVLRKSRFAYWAAPLAILVIWGMAMPLVRQWERSKESARDMIAGANALLDYASRRPDLVYLDIDSVAGEHYERKFLDLKRGRGMIANVLPLFGWHLHSPTYKRQLQLAGIANPARIMTQPNVRLVTQLQYGDIRKQALRNYLRLVCGIEVELKPDDTIADRYVIYRLLPVKGSVAPARR